MITHERLLEVLDYDPETGVFTWKIKSAARIKIGDVLCSKHHSGYVTGRVEKKFYRLHRLAIFYTDGVWPPGDVDHIDHNRSNNRRDNLRVATRSENQRNVKVRKDNRIGVKGISFRNKSGGQYICRIYTEKGKREYLGCFKTLEEAKDVIRKVRKEYHGEFLHD